MENHLVIMARAPRLGRGKRRLARDIGPLAAQQFYRRSTGALLRRLSGQPFWRLWLAITPDPAGGAPRGLWPFAGELRGQGRGDLGARMGRLFQDLPPGPVVIVGSDIPGITRRHIRRAFACLGDHDWVIGPADDGGYWLIGARRRPSLRLPFAAVRWSSPHTLADTRSDLKDQRVAELDRLTDIDTGADWRRWRDAGKN